MYTTIVRRTFDPARMQETRERAQREFFPTLQQAPGLIGFYLVADNEQSVNTAITVWENKESADAFWPQVEAWSRTLDSFGNRMETMNRGETVIEIMPQK
jgi:quinol monooxygenase YgiN